MKYKKKLNKKMYKNTKDSTFIIRQALRMKLHNTFNIFRLKLVINKNKKK